MEFKTSNALPIHCSSSPHSRIIARPQIRINQPAMGRSETDVYSLQCFTSSSSSSCYFQLPPGHKQGQGESSIKGREEKSQVAGAAIFLALCPLMARLHSQDAFVHLGPSHIDPLAQTIPFSSLLMTYVINSCSSGKLHTAAFCGVVLPPTHNLFRFFGEGQSQLHFLLSTLVQTPTTGLSLFSVIKASLS